MNRDAPKGASDDAVNVTDDPNTSVELEHFGMVPVRALRLSLSKPGLRLLVTMSYHAGGNRQCYAAQATLAAECGWSNGSYPDTSRVRRYLTELEGLDLIRPAGRHVWKDHHWTNAYWVAPYLDSDRTSPSVDSDRTSPSALDPIATSGSVDSDRTSRAIATARHTEVDPSRDHSKRSTNGASSIEEDRQTRRVLADPSGCYLTHHSHDREAHTQWCYTWRAS